uniref:Uncharacterized protein n=1 Tax=Talaromyces marneffei PM1 TaxID=1077442 RepID=A0A093VDR0_TALMA
MDQGKGGDYQFPPFGELPVVSGQPQGSLWGFFDKGDEKDELGTLNLLTPSVVLNASREIKYGEHVQLDWSMDNLDCPSMGRIPLEHRIKDMTEEGFIGLDDEIRINTQTSSQWDSLKHLRWWQDNNADQTVPFAITEYAISLSDIENVLKWQGTECKQGDIFILRTGFLRWYHQANAFERAHGIRGARWIGMESTMESVQWLYGKHFSAVASDR